MKGFQYRWVVVDSTNGVLEYYEVRSIFNLIYSTDLLFLSPFFYYLLLFLRKKSTKKLRSLEDLLALW